MNSLEFIEKQIKQCKDFIKNLKRDEKLGFKWENADYKVFEEADAKNFSARSKYSIECLVYLKIMC